MLLIRLPRKQTAAVRKQIVQRTRRRSLSRELHRSRHPIDMARPTDFEVMPEAMLRRQRDWRRRRLREVPEEGGCQKKSQPEYPKVPAGRAARSRSKQL